MLMSLPERLGRPSLRTVLLGIIFLAVIPMLGVTVLTHLKAAQSLREMSTRQLLESAHIVARSTESELEATGRLLSGALTTLGPANRYEPNQMLADAGISSDYSILELQGDTIRGAENQPQEIIDLARSAAATKGVQVSNILTAPNMTGGADQITIAMAIPLNAPQRNTNPQNGTAENSENTNDVQYISIIRSTPDKLIQSLSRPNPGQQEQAKVVIAIVDGSGRIIGRSVDAAKFLGRPVPDWNALKSQGTDSGWFRATTLEGGRIVFSYQAIADTPGWMAVAGEPEKSFDWRWQEALLIMALASLLTISVALAAALWLAQRALRPIRDLAAHAQVVAQTANGDTQAQANIPPSPIAEFETLRTSLEAASVAQHAHVEELHEQDRQLRKSLAAQQRAERSARIGSWVFDPQTCTFETSAFYRELIGFSENEQNISWSEIAAHLDPETLKRSMAAVELCIRTGQPFEYELTHRRVDNSVFSAWLQGRAELSDDGRVQKVSGTLQDITERKEHNERLSILADNIPGGVIFRMQHPAHQHITFPYVSAGVEFLFGITPQEIMASPDALMRVITKEDRRILARAFIASVRSGDPIDVRFHAKTEDGRSLWLRLRAALHRHAAQDAAIWDGVMLDVTASQRAERALEKARDAAEKAERAKGDFLATMSHELRTPLNTLIGMSRLALQTQLDAKQRNYLEKINTSANVLLGLINDILDLSKIEAGGLELEDIPFRLDTILETVSSMTSLKAEEKGIELTFAVAPDVPAVLRGDPLRLGQVLTNLVGNAVKFTEKGDVIVSVRTADPNSSSPGNLQFSVRDTGIGMTQEQMDGLFQPFVQASVEVSRRYGGTGLGLAISRRLVDMMKGKIWVESAPGHGSEFFFTATLPPSDAENGAEGGFTPARALVDRRVLIVDDNDSARLALYDMVVNFGMRADVAANGQEALDILHERAANGIRYDIILLDWQMPVMDGIDVARHIKDDARLLGMPAVLMVTAYRQQEVMPLIHGLGLRQILLKPVTQSIMFNTVLGIIATTERSKPEVTAPVRDDLAPFAALSGKHVLVVDDNALNREVASDFLDIVGVTVDTAENGQEAIEKLKNGTFDAVLMDVHMPVMNGFDATREIRRNPEWGKLPIIALTAQAGAAAELASIAAGMSGHLTKPIDDITLYRILLEQFEDPSATSTTTLLPEQPPAPARFILDVPALQKRFGGSAERIERLARGFLQDIDDVPASLQNHLAQNDEQAVAELAHRIKGMVGYFGADALWKQAEYLEEAARDGNIPKMHDMAGPFTTMLDDCITTLRAWIANR